MKTKQIFAVIYAAALGISLIGCSDSGNSSSEINKTNISDNTAKVTSDTVSDDSISVPVSESTSASTETIPRMTLISIEKETIIVTKSEKIKAMESMISDLGQRKIMTQINDIRDADSETAVIPESGGDDESTHTTINMDLAEKFNEHSQTE
ncbi:hypothetical protein [Porcipelethomonas sp.]|uniref:hypothetical protein n=1 Tax=Porcipelethomonas sp. TaxID=2981675 RepID=UPI003EFAD6A4